MRARDPFDILSTCTLKLTAKEGRISSHITFAINCGDGTIQKTLPIRFIDPNLLNTLLHTHNVIITDTTTERIIHDYIKDPESYPVHLPDGHPKCKTTVKVTEKNNTLYLVTIKNCHGAQKVLQKPLSKMRKTFLERLIRSSSTTIADDFSYKKIREYLYA